MVEYHVEQYWTGWWGGWGNSGGLQERLNNLAAQGWRLIRSERSWALYLWFLARPKLLLVFEREAGKPQT